MTADYLEFLDRMNGHAHDHAKDGEGSRALRELESIAADDIEAVYQKFDDELVENTLQKNTLAVIFGASNSGKTFLAINLACAIAGGRPWFKRATTQGLVVYLASEAPGSVINRIRAHKMRFSPNLHLLHVIKSPVNLYESEDDATAVLAKIAAIEALTGEKVALVIGDTLAAMAAGANENAGEDMNRVLRNVARIREATGATFLLIHHSGKDSTKGMRGWSGLRAAVDTEIEVSDDEDTDLKTAEVTKQRDIPGKGTRFVFKLEIELLGKNAWNNHRFSCVVIPHERQAADHIEDMPQPVKADGIGPAVVQFIQLSKGAATRAEVAKAVTAKHGFHYGAVFNAIDRMLKRKALRIQDGTLRVVPPRVADDDGQDDD